MADAIPRVREALGISSLLVEHDMAFVMGLADGVTVLDFGRCIADGTPERGPARPGGARGLPRRRTHTSDGGGRMTQFLELLVSGLSLGCIYALIAIGFVIVFKATNVINFAHGSVLMLGAYLVARWHDRARLPRARWRPRPSSCAVVAALLDVCWSRRCAAPRRRSTRWRS